MKTPRFLPALSLAAALACLPGSTGCRFGHSEDVMERFASISRLQGREYVAARDAFLAEHGPELLALGAASQAASRENKPPQGDAPAQGEAPDFSAILKCRAAHPREAAEFTGLLTGEDSAAWNPDRNNPRPTALRIASALGKFGRAFSPLGEEFLLRIASAEAPDNGDSDMAYPGTEALALWYRDVDTARGRQVLLQSIRGDAAIADTAGAIGALPSAKTGAKITGLKILGARDALPEVKRIYRNAKEKNLKWIALDFLAENRDPEIRRDILDMLADDTLADPDRDFLVGAFLAYQDGDYQAKRRSAYPLLPAGKSRKRLLESVSLQAPGDVEAWERLAAEEPDRALKADITDRIAAFRKQDPNRHGKPDRNQDRKQASPPESKER